MLLFKALIALTAPTTLTALIVGTVSVAVGTVRSSLTLRTALSADRCDTSHTRDCSNWSAPDCSNYSTALTSVVTAMTPLTALIALL